MLKLPKRTCFLSLRVNSCADFFMPDPPHPPLPFVCTAGTQMCAHVKDPISICRKRVDLTAGGMKTRKLHTGKISWVARELWQLAFPGESSPNCPCIAFGQEHKTKVYPLKTPQWLIGRAGHSSNLQEAKTLLRMCVCAFVFYLYCKRPGSKTLT